MEEIIPTYIEDEMRRSYIDYAMSVIVGRALPDIRDGLKPVHRRILYAMRELGLLHNRPFRKSASVVGEVLGKYHPHGDSSVYDALVRMVQEFSLRYPLVMGQGNFGSIDGDAAAAYRYTEAKLSQFAELMLRDIEKETVSFQPNFDGRLKEPSILPSAFPNLLVNGSSGIAVGMATNIPPHNLSEVIDALVAKIDNPDLEDFLEYIKGPDFPTAGIIAGKGEILNAYSTGRGKIKLKAETSIETLKNGKDIIIISSIPYQVNKSMVVSQIADLVRSKRIEGISDIRDESDRSGIRVVIELKAGAPTEVILNFLFKHTSLRVTFGMNLLVLQNGVPKLLNLREFLVSFLDYRYLVIKRRTEFDLREAKKRAHILEGLKIAQENIDEVVKIIRGAKNEKEAKEGLKESFNLSDIQIQAILNMRLGRLVGLEREKLEQEYLEVEKLIKKLEGILQTRESVMKVVKQELLDIREKFGDERRTKIVEGEEDIEIEDLIPNVPSLITLTAKGYIKRSKPSAYPRQLRGGSGVRGITLVQDDEVIKIFETLTHNIVIFFTNLGRCYSIKAYQIPRFERNARGKPVANIISLQEKEYVKIVLPRGEGIVVIITRKGIIKKLKFSKFDRIRRTGIIAIALKEGDEVASVTEINPEDYIFIVTKNGKIIKFKEEKLRELSRTSQGVRGIRLKDNDEVLSLTSTSIQEKEDLFLVTSDGYGKRVPTSRFRVTNRGGVGVIGSRVKLAGCEIVDKNSEIILVTKDGQALRARVDKIRKMKSRATRGVRVVRLKKGDEIKDVYKI